MEFIKIVIFTSGYLLSNLAFSCSCIELPIAEKIKRASKIIEGVVIKAELIPTPGFDRTVKYTFKIDKIYKGKTGKVLSVFTSAEFATCGTTFDVGSKYVVLVEKNNQVGLCGAQEKWYDSKWKNRIDIQQNGLLQELRK